MKKRFVFKVLLKELIVIALTAFLLKGILFLIDLPVESSDKETLKIILLYLVLISFILFSIFFKKKDILGMVAMTFFAIIFCGFLYAAAHLHQEAILEEPGYLFPSIVAISLIAIIFISLWVAGIFADREYRGNPWKEVYFQASLFGVFVISTTIFIWILSPILSEYPIFSLMK